MSTLHLVYLVIALQVLDGLTTIIALQRPGTREGNGFVAKIMSRLGVVPTMVVLKGASIAAVWFGAPYVYPWALWLIAAIYVAIVGNNLLVLYRTRQAS